MIMIKNIAALAVAATIGATANQVISSSVEGQIPKPRYQVHVLDIQATGRLPDGGVQASVKAYGRRQLADGGLKDLGYGNVCIGQKTIDKTAAALLIAAEACIVEEN